jgi:hypothetical protein
MLQCTPTQHNNKENRAGHYFMRIAHLDTAALGTGHKTG